MLHGQQGRMSEASTEARGMSEVQPNGVSAPVAGGEEIPSLRSKGEHLEIERSNAQLRPEPIAAMRARSIPDHNM